MNNLINRRKKQRFEPKVKTIAEFEKSKHGLITDISMHGLAFKYYDFGFERKGNTRAFLQVTVSHYDDFIVENLPCKIVNDFSLLPEVEEFSIEMRKCCLQFDELAPNQKAHLEYFINNFTAENSGTTTSKEKLSREQEPLVSRFISTVDNN